MIGMSKPCWKTEFDHVMEHVCPLWRDLCTERAVPPLFRPLGGFGGRYVVDPAFVQRFGAQIILAHMKMYFKRTGLILNKGILIGTPNFPALPRGADKFVFFDHNVDDHGVKLISRNARIGFRKPLRAWISSPTLIVHAPHDITLDCEVWVR